jgi:ABC-type branched-subunit amino acid transport system ATPase component
MLKIKNLTGGYIKGQNVLNGIDFEINEGDCAGFIGLNGCGKSSLTKAIMNLLPYRDGKIEFLNKDVTGIATDKLTKRGILLFMQGGVVFDEMTVLENLALYGKWEKEGELLQYFPFLQKTKKELSKIGADKLSGGERNQVALAMCLLQKPYLLILDEPSAGLAPMVVENMYKTLAHIREQSPTTIILVEQNIARAIEFCDSVNMLKGGQIAYSSRDKNLKEIEDIMFSGSGVQALGSR